MSAWMWPAAGAAAGIASSIFGGGDQEQQIELDETTRKLQHVLLKPETARVHPRRESPLTYNVWDLPEVGYGPHRVYQGPSPAAQRAYGGLLGRAMGSPYEAAAGDYATRAITGENLYTNPAMGPLGFYGMGGGMPNLAGGPGRALMLGTAAGSGYSNPYLDAMVNQAQRRTGANVASMFGRGGMGGSSMEQQLAAREMGDIASRMYGGAYEAERGRQTAMQQALGGLETSRLGLGVTGRGQGIQAASTLGSLFGQERGLQQEAAYNVPGLTASDLARLQAGVGAATGLEGYGQRQREEERQAWLANQMAPYNRLGFIGGQSAAQPYGQTTTTSGPGPNPITSALGGALAGYGLYRMGGFGGGGAQPYSTGATVPGYPGYGPYGSRAGGWV